MTRPGPSVKHLVRHMNPNYYKTSTGEYIRRGEVASITQNLDRDRLTIRWMDPNRRDTELCSLQWACLAEELFSTLCPGAPAPELVPDGDPVPFKDLPSGLFRCSGGWGYKDTVGEVEPVDEFTLTIPEEELVQPYRIREH